ncbi:MAG: deoxyribose-phosphate aldolase [Lachnospiraceae bacterium]|jgi:deoxyribose-phosphate aldolase|nr:deoxyribose-phosphate aldolase [Lachnospiraceae bacterium]RKJ48899.1 deoxyribose-phosphate aldolase [bacterium 1XD42-54]
MKKKITVQDVADVLDHSLLRPDITVSELVEGCTLAKEYKTVSVCVRPSDLPIVCKELEGTKVLPTTVIGFPHGTCTTETKVFETVDAVNKGAVEVDMVMNIGRFLSGEYDYVARDIAEVAAAAHEGNAKLKVIFENHYLTDEQIVKACEIAKAAGADFIKTSTGYAGSGAKLPDLKIMVDHADGMLVKAAGGVKTLDDCLAIMALGVVRCGTRSSKAILEEACVRAKDGQLFLNTEE